MSQPSHHTLHNKLATRETLHIQLIQVLEGNYKSTIMTHIRHNTIWSLNLTGGALLIKFQQLQQKYHELTNEAFPRFDYQLIIGLLIVLGFDSELGFVEVSEEEFLSVH